MARKKIIETVTENPWKKLVDLADSLYINLNEQYKTTCTNEVSSMLISLSLITNTLKRQHDVWESRK